MNQAASNQDLMTVVLELCAEVRSLQAEVAKIGGVAAPTGDVWLRTNAAAAALSTQGITSGQVLRRFIQNGVLSEAQAQIRNAAIGDARPEWEFNIAACSDRIAWYKSLTSDQKRAITT